MTAPAFTAAEARSRSTFLALMWALSYPGRTQELSLEPDAEPFSVIAETLLDLETSYFTSDPALAAQLSHTMARPESIGQAEYIFYPQVQADDLATITGASIGNMLFPDQSATLILGCTFDSGTELRLTGPGIGGEATATIRVGGIPAAFWPLHDAQRRYPLGWDVFLVSGAQVIGLPRSITLSY